MALTLDNAGALVPGMKLEDNMQKPAEAKVRVLRPFYVGSVVQEKGKIVTLPITLAQEMVVSNKAEFVYDAYHPPIATEGELVKGKAEKSK